MGAKSLYRLAELEREFGIESSVGSAPTALALHDTPPSVDRQKVIAKLKRQIENIEIQATGIKATVLELEK